MNAYLALSVSIGLGVVGQVCLKMGAVRDLSIYRWALQPYLLLGLSSYFVSALFYIFSLRTLPLSVAFPSVSVSYVLVALLAHLIWNEPFGLQQLLALLFIGFGLYLCFRP